MKDQEPRATDEGNSNQASATGGQSPDSEIAIPPASVATTNETGDTAVHQPSPHPNPAQPPVLVNVLPQPVKSDKWMTILTAVIALATIANVIIFYFESEDSTRKISALSANAGEIVKSMNIALGDSRDAIIEAFQANKDAVEASNLQNKRSVEASLKVAAETNRIAMRAMEVSERPWIGFVGADIKDNIERGKALSGHAIILNSGRSPAIHVRIEFTIQ